MSAQPPQVHWTDPADGSPGQADWRSLAGHPPPSLVQVVDDRLGADAALRQAEAGTGLLWQGDFQNARHLLQAMARRIDARERRPGAAAAAVTPAPAFAAHRQRQARRARLLGQVLLRFGADHGLALPRAPDVRDAGLAAHGPVDRPYVASLRELLGLVGAHEWRKKGVPIPALGGAHIHPHHGVFSPVRGEYVDLVAQAPLPGVVHGAGAFDIGTGTGVLAAVLARRKLRVVATDNQPAALECARANIDRLGLARRVQVVQADLFPPGHAGLVVCNPPWLPAQPASPLEAAVYDPDSRMLRGFLAGLAQHLSRGGEGWLILSDLAEHLGLRRRDELLGWIAEGGLQVLGRLDTRPSHPKALDPADPLAPARQAEVTSLWRLGRA
jgi:methylase of polypeptide subunit release factors